MNKPLCKSVVPLLLVVLLLATTAFASVADWKFPPYPNVWDLQISLDPRTTFPRLRIHSLENGEVVIGHADKGSPKARSENVLRQENLRWIGFFSGLPARSFNETTEEFTLHDGTTSKIAKSKRQVDPNAAELKDGSYVVSSQNSLKDCFLGPDRSHLNRYVNSASPLPPDVFRKQLDPTKVIFLLLDEPIHWRGAAYEECEESDTSLSIRVWALYGRIVPLEDGGFLLVDERAGWIARFTSNLTTESEYLNKKIFIFDLEPRNQSWYVPGKTEQDYLDTTGKISMQAVLDDLYAYLLSTKRGGN